MTPIKIIVWTELSRELANKPHWIEKLLAWLRILPAEEPLYYLTVKITTDIFDYLHVGDSLLIPRGSGNHNVFVVLRTIHGRQYIIINVGPMPEKDCAPYYGEIVLLGSNYVKHS